MDKHKILAKVVLLAFVFSVFLPTSAYAEEGTAPAPSVLLANPDTLRSVYASSKISLEFKAENIPANSQVTITFPQNKSAIGKKLLQLNGSNDQSIGGDYKIDTNKNTITWTPNGSNLQINATADTAALADTKVTFAYQVSGYTGTLAADTVTMTIAAKPINWGGTGDNSKKESTLTFKREPFVQESDPAKQQFVKATAVLELRDTYRNPTSEVTSGQSLYVWAEKVGASNVLAEIYGTEKDGSIQLGSCTLTKIGGSNVYRVNAITGDTLTFPIRVQSQQNGRFQFNVVQGSSNLSEASGIRALKEKSGLAAEQELTLQTLTISDDGRIKTDAARAKDAERGKINIQISDISGNVAVRLPEGFRTKNDVERTDTETGKKYYLVPVDPTQPYVQVTAVPTGGQKTYQRSSAELNDGFQLYIDDKPYETVQYNCTIHVQPADLQVLITNSGEFRSSLEHIKKPNKLTLSLKNIGSGRNFVYVYFPQKTVSGASSLIEPQDSGNVEEVALNGADYWRFKATLSAITEGKAVPLEIPLVPLTQETLYNEEMALKVETYNLNSEIYEAGAANLRYRITDTMAEVGVGTTFDRPAVQQESVVDGETIYQTKLTLQVNSGYLNGNKLYVWVAKKGESTEGQLAKGRFGVDIGDGNRTWQTTNALVGEGTLTGSNNLFMISRLDGDEDLDPDKSGQVSIPLLISSKAFGDEYYVRAAFAESAQKALALPAAQILDSAEFSFTSVAAIPVVSLSNSGLLYDNDPWGKLAYRLANLDQVLKQGDKVRLTLPELFWPETDGKDEGGKPTKVKTPQSLLITLGAPDDSGTFSGTVQLNYVPPVSADELAKGQYTMTIPGSELAACKLENEATGAVFDNARFDGELTITHKWAAADIQIDLTAGSGLTVGGNGQPQLQVGETANVNIALQGEKAESFQDCALAVWLEDGKQKILAGTNYLTIPNDYTVTTQNVDRGKQVITLPKPDDASKIVIPLSVAGLKDLGSYQLRAQVVKITYSTPDKDKITGYTGYVDGGLIFNLVAKPIAQWQFKTLTVNDVALTGDTTNTYTAAPKGFAEELTIKAQLADAQGAPLAGQTVKAAAGGLSIEASQITDAQGYAIFKVKTPSVAGDYLIKLSVDGESGFEAVLKLPVVADPSGGSETKPEEYDNLELKIENMTSTVARDDRASMYLQVYDADDDLVKVTSDAMAEKIIRSVTLTDKPSASDLRSGSIGYRRVGDGIEVYFYPDVVGSYEVTIRGTGKEASVLRPDVYAIRQGKVVRMELVYPESTLRVGDCSSPAVLYTYDEDDVKAEKSLLARGISVYATGSALESISDVGIVTVRDSSRYVGNTIKVVVTDEKLVLQADYIFDIDEYTSSSGGSGNAGDTTGTKRLVLWDNYGGVQVTNRFEFYLTDKSGFRAMLKNGQMSSSNGASAAVSVVSRPSGATVRADIYQDGRTLEDNGYGYLDLYCSKEGVVRLNITIKVYNPDDSTNYNKRYDYYRETVEINVTDHITSSNLNNSSGYYNNYGYTGSSTTNKNNNNISVAMFVGSTKYTVNTIQQQLDTAPYIENSRTYVPLRALGDALGASVSYDDKSQRIVLVYNGERVEMQIDSNVVTTTKGGIYQADAVPEIRDGRTMIPLRTAAEALGCQVEAVSDQYGSTIGALFSK